MCDYLDTVTWHDLLSSIQSMGFPLVFGVRVRDGSGSAPCSKPETRPQQKVCQEAANGIVHSQKGG